MAEGREEDIPRDAKIVKTLLKFMNGYDYEPRVVHQFLELWYWYVVEVLTDAQVYSEHAGKFTIDSDDVKLAIQSKVSFSFSQPLPRQTSSTIWFMLLVLVPLWTFNPCNSFVHKCNSMLLELARSRNKIPWPKSITQYGIPLHPEQDTLISTNYQLAIPKMHGGQPVEETEEDEEGADPNPNAFPTSNLS